MTARASSRVLVSLSVVVLLAAPAAAQQFVFANNQFPTGANNNSLSDAIDFGDVDGDGDLDALCADGGDSGLDQSRLWLNQGGTQGGTIGFFTDATAAQCPAVLGSSRDIELSDIDLDGDLDIYLSNTSQSSNQTSRWWVNMGGAQGGSAGFFADQTAARWLNLNGPGTSVAASLVLPSGGFIDYACDCDFGDLDADGDPDLIHSTYGQNATGTVPTRLYLNDGAGQFIEFNPSGFRLTGTDIQNGNPGLWCEGNQQNGTMLTNGTVCDIADMILDVDVHDFDGDLDLDLLMGGLGNPRPRVYVNRREELGGTLAFRDVTGARLPSNVVGGYDEDVGDVDNDDDLDIYGMNWGGGGPGLSDVALINNGAGTFGGLQVLPLSDSDDNDADFLDYDNDGDLDLFVSGFFTEDQMYRNQFIGAGAFSFVDVTTSVVPASFSGAFDVEAFDLDDDGDPEIVLATSGPNLLLKNTLNVADVHAPRCVKLAQAPNRVAGPLPTVVRVQVYDNHHFDETWFHDVRIEWRVVPGAFVSTPMRVSHGQIWRGEIPGGLVGTVEYRVVAIDGSGNTGTSATKSYVGGCPASVAYCTAGTTSSGCTATLSSLGSPSATAPNGFVVTANGVEGQRAGLLFYGTSGRIASPWGGGSTSYICVAMPTQRTTSFSSGGTAGQCNGVLALDWNAYISATPAALGVPFSGGEVVDAQIWFRDPPSPKTTSLSNALEFVVCP